jgi:hypothetical protein
MPKSGVSETVFAINTIEVTGIVALLLIVVQYPTFEVIKD